MPGARELRRLRWKPLLPALVLTLLSIPLIFGWLGSYSLVNGDEAFYQGVSERMVETGEWFTITFRGQPRILDTFFNAPIHYWARAALIAIFGSNLWTARILSALFALGTVLVSYRLAHRLSDRFGGLLAGLVQLTTFQFLFLHSARTGELEPIVCFFIILAASSFLSGSEGKSFVGHHLCVVALVNLKIPLAVLPLLAALAAFAAAPGLRPQFIRWLKTGLVVVPCGFLWHFFKLIEFRDAAIPPLRDMFEIAPGSGGATDALHSVAFYAPRILFGAFPYSLLYPLAVFLAFRIAGRSPEDRARLIVVAFFPAAILLFFALVPQLHPWYIIPIYPFLSVFVGVWLARQRLERLSLTVIVPAAVATALLLLLDVRVSATNPFANSAFFVPMETIWRVEGGVAIVALVLLAAVVAGLLILGRRVLRTRAQSLFTLALATLFVGYGAVRCAVTLQHRHYQSPAAELRRQMDRALLEGRPIDDLPRIVPGAGSYLARYWFAEDFRVRRMSPRIARQRGLPTEGPIYRIVRVLPRAGKRDEPLVREWQRHPGRIR